MLFNSWEYLFFFPIVVLITFLLSKDAYKRLFLLAASYFFYMSWNPVYLVLILGSTLWAYYAARFMGRAEDENRRRLVMQLSVVFNLGILSYFKYYNFIADNFEFLFMKLGLDLTIPEHNWILPVGISFYTFQALGYIVDVYNRKINPEASFVVFGLYVSYFPQLVAGPIERASNLLPQLKAKIQFGHYNAVLGLRLILLGLFKKIVVADRLALYVDQVFNSTGTYSGISVLLASVLFVFQIFCDFSAYSDIAIGSSRVFGIKLMDNFKGPLLSRNISELWRRWHISLSTWIRDYVYNPLTFKYRHKGQSFFLSMIVFTFVLVGVWHGANWTFVVFGLLHGLVLAYEAMSAKFRRKMKKRFMPLLYISLSIFLTFSFWTFTCLIFRANNMSEAWIHMGSIVTLSEGLSLMGELLKSTTELGIIGLSLLIIMIFHVIEYYYDISKIAGRVLPLIRWCIYLLLSLSILFWGIFDYNEFIYFQF